MNPGGPHSLGTCHIHLRLACAQNWRVHAYAGKLDLSWGASNICITGGPEGMGKGCRLLACMHPFQALAYFRVGATCEAVTALCHEYRSIVHDNGSERKMQRKTGTGKPVNEP